MVLPVVTVACMPDAAAAPDLWPEAAAARGEAELEEALAMCVSMRETERRSLEIWRLLSEFGCNEAGGANSEAMRCPPSGCEPAANNSGAMNLSGYYEGMQ